MSETRRNSPCENWLAKCLGPLARKSQFATAHCRLTILGNAGPTSRARNNCSVGRRQSPSMKESKKPSITLRSDMITVAGRWFKPRIWNDVPCKLLHVQEKVYEFEQVPSNEKDDVIKRLAIVNLERNQCIDKLDQEFRASIEHLRN